MFKKFLQLMNIRTQEERERDLYNAFLKHEANIGGTIFGPVPEGVRREFFCLDENTWIWYEEWTDKDRKKQVRTTAYEARPEGILKSIDGGEHFVRLTDDELEHLLGAIDTYEQRINTEIYQALA